MDKKSQDWEKARLLAESPVGQQLMEMLRQQNRGQMEQAAAQANAGDLEAAAKSLQSLLSSPEAQRLLGQLGR